MTLVNEGKDQVDHLVHVFENYLVKTHKIIINIKVSTHMRWIRLH